MKMKTVCKSDFLQKRKATITKVNKENKQSKFRQSLTEKDAIKMFENANTNKKSTVISADLLALKAFKESKFID